MRFLAVLLVAALLFPACTGLRLGDGPPRQARIVQVTVTDAPLADPADGSGWDGSAGGGPELYVRLFDAYVDYRDPRRFGDDRLNPRDDAFVTARASEEPWYGDVTVRDFPLVWDVEDGFLIRDLNAPLRVVLYDYDPTNDDDVVGATEAVVLADVAPPRAGSRVEVVDLVGEGPGGRDVGVRLFVVYED